MIVSASILWIPTKDFTTYPNANPEVLILTKVGSVEFTVPIPVRTKDSEVGAYNLSVNEMLPTTSIFCCGFVVPTPRLPAT